MSKVKVIQVKDTKFTNRAFCSISRLKIFTRVAVLGLGLRSEVKGQGHLKVK